MDKGRLWFPTTTICIRCLQTLLEIPQTHTFPVQYLLLDQIPRPIIYSRFHIILRLLSRDEINAAQMKQEQISYWTAEYSEYSHCTGM